MDTLSAYAHSGTAETAGFVDDDSDGEVESAPDDIPDGHESLDYVSDHEPQDEHKERKGSIISKYQLPDSPDVVEAAAGKADPFHKGTHWECRIVPDDFQGTKECLPDGTLKPRRPVPHVRASDFFQSLVQLKDGRWYFSGVLNAWPAFTNLEVRSLTYKHRGRNVRSWSAQKSNERPFWPSKTVGTLGKRAHKPVKMLRAHLRLPAWSNFGYSQDSPGFVFWYQRFHTPPRLLFGENIVQTLLAEAPTRPIARAVRIHQFAHRYAKLKETAKDKLSYHTGVLVEWDHAQYCSVFELGWLGGLGGYNGRSNWCDDRDEPRTSLYDVLPDELKMPWRSDRCEIRITDVPAKNLGEFIEYLHKYASPTMRFIDPEIFGSSKVAVSLASADHLLRYILNYVLWDSTYTEEGKNCQTFVADFYGFLAGKEKNQPFTSVMKLLYKDKRHLFLYTPGSVDTIHMKP